MKAIFFDIDGTLVGFDGHMPESARRALDLAREKGHKLILCTGRNAVQIYPELKEYGFDAIVSSAGACVICEGKEISHDFMDRKHLDQFVSYFEGTGICFGVQAASGSFVNEVSRDLMLEKFHKLGVGADMMDTIMKNLSIDNHLREHDDVEKTFYNSAPQTVAEVQEALGDYFLVQQSSIGFEDDYSGEVTIRGVMKSSGMEHVLSYFGLTREDSIAFGDGQNDIDMMEYAGMGVAMDNAMDCVKEVADMVTDSVSEDGIYNAMMKLQLIG